jgi:two-component system, chemotaxis family, chemotaxis protein CheY
VCEEARAIHMKKNILIIEDDNSVRFLLDMYLRKHYSVTAKRDGYDALMWMNSGNIPDLILADIEMPKCNGYELIRNVRKSGYFRDIPIMILSGWNFTEAKVKCMQEGANDFMGKPFNPTTLLANIKKLMKEEN